MQTTAYEGYFLDGRFYVAGENVRIPEMKRVVVTIMEDIPNTGGLKVHAAALHKGKRELGFLKGKVPELPDSFFNPMTEEDLELWGM